VVGFRLHANCHGFLLQSVSTTYRLLYTCIVPAEQELDGQIMQKFSTEMLVAGEVSSARHYYRLRACLFGKRYRTLVASPAFSVSLILLTG
jgi:hypothetical protein